MTEALDEGLGLLDIIEAHELAPQFEASLLAVNAASPPWGAIDGIAPVLLVEQGAEDVFVAGSGRCCAGSDALALAVRQR